MDARKRKRLEAAGFRVGSVSDFLSLSAAEARFVELKASLAARLVERRRELNFTQQQLAHQLESSQSRVAKMEAANESVSVDLLLRALFIMGESTAAVANAIHDPRLKPAKPAKRAPRRSEASSPAASAHGSASSHTKA